MTTYLSFKDKDGMKLLEVLDIFSVYIVIKVSQVYAYLQTHEIVYV